MGFRLCRLEAAGFRGINRPLTLDLGPRLTVVFGNNGAGKSSLLQAVAWGLFGALGDIEGAEFRQEDALVNAFSPQHLARVCLTLAAGGETLTIERSRRLGRSTTARSDLTLRQGTDVWCDDAAGAQLTRRLGLQAAECYAAVMVRQDAIRTLAAGDQAERSAAIDRLLGLATLRELAGGLPAAQVAREVARVGREIEGQQAAGLTTTLNLRRLLTQREDALLARSIAPAGLSLRALNDDLAAAEAELAGVHSALELPAQPAAVQPEARLAALRTGVVAARRQRDEALRDAYRRRADLDAAMHSARAAEDGGGDDSAERAAEIGHALAALEPRLEQLRREREGLRALAAEETEAARDLAAAEAHLRALVESSGDAGVVTAALERLQRQLAELTGEGKRHRARATLLGDALELTQAERPDTCPVCARPIDPDTLAQHLHDALAQSGAVAQLAALRARYRELEAARRRMLEVRATLAAAQERVYRFGESLAAIRHRGEQGRQRRAGGTTEPTDHLAALEQELGELERQRQPLQIELRLAEERERRQAQRDAAGRAALAALARQLGLGEHSPQPLLRQAEQRRARLDGRLAQLEGLAAPLAAVDAAMQRAAAIADYLDLKRDVERLDGDGTDPERRLDGLLAAKARLTELHEGLVAIQAAAVAEGEDALRRSLDTLLPVMNDYFRRLGGHPVFSALTLQPREQRGANAYRLLAEEPGGEHSTLLPTRFSTTQMHVAALALFLALGDRLPSALDLLLLDDPTQSMDAPHIAALAALLAGEAERRQVIVATADAAFLAALLAQTGASAAVVRLGDWDAAGVQTST